MSELCNFHFISKSDLDGNIEEIVFDSKGYKSVNNGEIIYYFKDENKYKFVILDNLVNVFVNESNYKFEKNKKTEAIINTSGYCIKASIFTSELVILDNKILIKYTLDFGSFKGNYSIILELL